MKKKTLVLANNSDGLYGFRKELLLALNRKGSVCISVPDNGYFEELRELGCSIVHTPVDRRGLTL